MIAGGRGMIATPRHEDGKNPIHVEVGDVSCFGVVKGRGQGEKRRMHGSCVRTTMYS